MYRNKGYSFTITSSTAYDQKFMYGRNIYQSISDVVDEMFQNYLSRPNVRQPILTQYCDGQIQEQLARISRSYPAIPTITPDGIYGPETREAVERFQSIFGLPVTGVIDFRTWYRISEIYVAVTRIAELV